MITFFVCIAILVGGYFTYGRIVDKILAPNDARLTPAKRLADNVDYVELPWWKVLLTQFLNIAGLGPIFGSILGALFGPVAFLWITFGCLFVGAVADFLSGFISLRHDGLSITELVGLYLGSKAQKFMLVFTFILSVLVGVTFTMAPARWLNLQLELPYTITESAGVVPWVWVLIIIAYYIIATIFPIETFIAKIFPVLSIAMLASCVILLVALFFNLGENGLGLSMMEMRWDFGLHPNNISFFPFIFTTIACGAVSGFHAAKSPMMARCLGKETEAKRVFFGAMIIEGVVALIWCALTIAFFGEGILQTHFNAATGVYANQVTLLGGQLGVVDTMANTFLPGWLAAVLVFTAVIIFPITTADTGFRSVRLMFADAFEWSQTTIKSRILVAIPVFLIAYALTWVNFQTIWQYFAWSNLSIAAIVLWMSSRYLIINNKTHWFSTIPAVITSVASVAYIMQAPEGFQFIWGGINNYGLISNVIGIAFGLGLLMIFLITKKNAVVKQGHLSFEKLENE